MLTASYEYPRVHRAHTTFVRDDHGHLWLVVRSGDAVRRVRVTGEAWAESRCPPRTPEDA